MMEPTTARILRKNLGHVVQQLRPGLWQIVFHWPATTNCWLWQEEDGLTLIDAGQPWNARDILTAIDYLQAPLKRIVITHAHPDHAGAAAEVAIRTGAVVFVHELDAPFLEGKASMADLPGFWLCRAVLNFGRGLGILHPPPVEGFKCVGEGEQVGRLRIIHTPGHTPGSISLWAEEAGAIFVGDNLFGLKGVQFGLPWFTLDLETRNLCLQKYIELGATMILSGHGPAYQSRELHQDMMKLAGSKRR